MTVLNLDCRHGLAMLPDNSVDAILTDPPYHLVQNSRGGSPQPGDLKTPFGRSGPSRARGFMGCEWDGGDIAFQVDLWREALRVLKPGGHMLAFSGSRTYHRMTCAIEDAGFEIRDSIMWVYGSGFPKSLDISKAIDKLHGAERQVVGQQYRAATGRDEGYGFGESFDITAPATMAAQIWEGWGTALKPAHEPICVARKPLALGTVAANVLAYGVGGINIDGCRVGTEPPAPRNAPKKIMRGGKFHAAADAETEMSHYNPTLGRWPANLIHDGSDEVLAGFPVTTSGSIKPYERANRGGWSGPTPEASTFERAGDIGSAARFFYCAKASKRDRDEGLEGFALRNNMRVNGPRESEEAKTATLRANHHPTVKPTDLMRYLCRLVTPPGGLIVDPFAGSGSTGKAAILEGFQFIGFELEAEFTDLANARIEHARASRG